MLSGVAAVAEVPHFRRTLQRICLSAAVVASLGAGLGCAPTRTTTARKAHGHSPLMNSPAAVKKACVTIFAAIRRQNARWRVVCPPKIPRVSQPSVIYVGGVAATANFSPGYALDGIGSVYPVINGYGHWTFRSGSPPLLESLLHPTDALGRPEGVVSSPQRLVVAGQTVQVYRVAPDMTEYADHVVVVWVDRGQEYQVSVHRWKSDEQGRRQAVAMAAAIIGQLKQSK